MLLTDINPYVRCARIFCAYDERLRMVPLRMPADCRIIYGIEGHSKISIGGRILNLKPNDLLIINAGVKYKTFKSKAKNIVINFDYTQNFSYAKWFVPPVFNIDDITEQVHFDDHPELNEYLYCENMYSIRSSVQKIFKEFQQKLPDYNIISSALLKSVILTAVRDSALSSRVNTALDIEGMLNYIHENFKKNINNNTLSEEFNFHPNYINNVFKKITGQTIHKYIIELRLTYAISLLEESDMTINEIAQETGFYDCSYFSKYLKKITGIGPKEYRKSK